jgi:hypothetical protein
MPENTGVPDAEQLGDLPGVRRGLDQMGWTGTLLMLAAGLVLAAYGWVFGGKRKQSFHVAIVPPTTIMFIGVLLIIIAGSHALTLLGIEHNRSQLRLN